jgi:hypothetical protein
MGFLWRWAFALILLVLTYNPTSLNYVAWTLENWGEQWPLTVLFGLILFITYVVFVTAVLRGIGVIGVALILALVGALVWVLVDIGWLDLTNPGLNTWIALFALSLVLALGMYWGILWRRLSGQIEVDDNDV